MARRRRDRQARKLKLPLRFLGARRYLAETWADDATEGRGFSARKTDVTAASELTVGLAPASGAYIRLTPVH